MARPAGGRANRARKDRLERIGRKIDVATERETLGTTGVNIAGYSNRRALSLFGQRLDQPLVLVEPTIGPKFLVAALSLC